MHLQPTLDENSTIEVVIEVPRGSFVKRSAAGGIDYVSPFPCPFNYGSIPGTLAPDGDPLDVVLLGPTRRVGDRVRATPRATVHFVDAGEPDPKLVCAPEPLSAADRRLVHAFFTVYAVLKGPLNRFRGRSGRTGLDGWSDAP